MKNTRISTFKDFVGELSVSYKRTTQPTVTVTGSRAVKDFIAPYFENCMDSHEEFKVIHLNRANKVVNVDEHSKGGKCSTTADVSIILRNALLIMTNSIIIVHNHPSGNLKASESDKNLTDKIKKGCEAVGLTLLDSIILTREGYYSFMDNGDM